MFLTGHAKLPNFQGSYHSTHDLKVIFIRRSCDEQGVIWKSYWDYLQNDEMMQILSKSSAVYFQIRVIFKYELKFFLNFNHVFVFQQ